MAHKVGASYAQLASNFAASKGNTIPRSLRSPSANDVSSIDEFAMIGDGSEGAAPSTARGDRSALLREVARAVRHDVAPLPQAVTGKSVEEPRNPCGDALPPVDSVAAAQGVQEWRKRDRESRRPAGVKPLGAETPAKDPLE